ncbi:MAG: glutamate 5-kinase [Myxococcota bacterium]
MDRPSTDRARLRGEKGTLVVKVGSRVLVAEPERLARLASELAALMAHDRVVLVSSGAIAMGLRVLGLERRPKRMAQLQAASAIGQGALMAAYRDAFAPHGITTGQVLLTHADLAARERFLHVRTAFEGLFAAGALPVVNENDCVAVDEIRFGDNDQLAAMVAAALDARLLVLLSDVEGVLDGEGTRISLLSPDTEVQLHGPRDDVGSGGMASKIQAAQAATSRGGVAVIASGAREGVLEAIVRGEDVGTLVVPTGPRLSSRKAWISVALRPKGVLAIDAGARAALRGGASLLAAGITDVEGEFAAGDPVRIVAEGTNVGQGLAAMGAAEVRLRLGERGVVVVHRDDLVRTERNDSA